MINKVMRGLVVVVMFAILFQAFKFECHYSRMGKVTNVQDEVITVVDDKTGNIWEFEGDGFAVNDKIKLKFFTNHTDEKIEDDYIVDAVRVD